MPEPWRRTGRKAGEDHFVGLESGAIIEAAAYHELGGRMGHFVCQVKKKDPLGTDKPPGQTWTGTMLAIEDGYYLWWYEHHIGALKSKVEGYFHFCEIPQGDCKSQGGYLNLIHIDVFRILQPDELSKVRWFSAGQKTEAPTLMTWTAPGGEVGDPAAAPSGVRPGAAGVTGLRAALERGPEGALEAEGAEPAQPAAKKRRSEEPAAKTEAGKDPEESDDGKSDDYSEAIRKRKPMKQMESALRLRRSKKKKSKKKKKKKEKASKKEGKGARSESSSDDSDDSSSDGSVFRMAPLPEGIERLKRTHLKRPGRLADLTLQRYRELLQRSTGRGADAEEMEVMPAVGRAYLQQVYFVKNPVSTLGVRTAREMRTLMLVVDYLARNMVPAALDVLLQRQKALELSVEQSSWQQANLLELVDMEEARSYFRQELKAAQSELRAEQRLGKGWGSQRQYPGWRPYGQGETSLQAKEGKDSDQAPLNEDGKKGKRKGKKGRGHGK
eukprot:Skav233093  [mRNA]  locus=scaffold3948:8226:9719:+ [translate_table: standard]